MIVGMNGAQASVVPFPQARKMVEEHAAMVRATAAELVGIAGDGDYVEIRRSVAVGENIVARGIEARAGEVLLPRGTRLDAAGIAVAASVGKSNLLAHALPTVAILATGDEIVDVAAEPGPHQIRNSNSYSLAAQVQAAGGLPVLLPIAADDAKQLRHLIEEGLAADLLLLAGGVSMG